MKNFLLTAVLWIGVVDRVENDIAIVHVSSSNSEEIQFEIPIQVFPCTIDEGGWFYFEYSDGVTEIRCGEPPT